MLTKACPAQIKAVGTDDGLEEGQFRALVSVFGNKDSYGDVVIPGAFAETLAAWQAKGDSIPVYWSHQMSDPDMNIGWVVKAEETSDGLEVVAQIDLDADASPKAKQAYRLLKGRRVTQFSFAYAIDEGAWVQRDDDSYYELRKLSLYEVGPTPIGANDQTELLGVKGAADHARVLVSEVKAGRVLAKTHIDSLRAAQEAIGAVIDAAEANDQEKASGDAQAKAEASDEDPEVKSSVDAEEPEWRPSVDDLATQLNLIAASAAERSH